jgi:hypothetical protein
MSLTLTGAIFGFVCLMILIHMVTKENATSNARWRMKTMMEQIDATHDTEALNPSADEWMSYNDLELYALCEARHHAQDIASRGFMEPYQNMCSFLHCTKKAKEADMSTHYAQTCVELSKEYLLNAQERGYSIRLGKYINATARLLDVLKEMNRRLENQEEENYNDT